MLHDETAPSPHFWTFAPNPDSLVVLRPWHWPRFYEVTQGYTKIHMRKRPISLLRSGKRPASYGCPNRTENALLYVGVFSTAGRIDKRQLLRRHAKPRTQYVKGEKVEFEFIIGTPKTKAELEEVKKEMHEYGDIVLLEERENMNTGKTYHFYRHLVKRNKAAPKFAFKSDDDTFIVVPNLVTLLKGLECSKLYYMGRCSDYSCGTSRAFPEFYTGMCYGLSAPLYQWIGSAPFTPRMLKGLEDVRTAQLLLSLDPDRPEEKLIRLNLDGRMKDLKYVGGGTEDINPQTLLAVHPFKTESGLMKIVSKLEKGQKPAKERGLREWLRRMMRLHE